MNKLFKASLVTILFAFSIILFQFSCRKEVSGKSGIALTKEQILVNKTWKVDLLHHVINGYYSEYENGGANTTGIPYEKLRFKFNADGTGTHINQTGQEYDFTWSLSPDKRTLILNVGFTVTRTFVWQMVEIADNYLHATTRLTLSGSSNNMETFRLIQDR